MTPEQAKALGVRVKALEWRVGTDADGLGMKFANTLWGQYCVSHDKDYGWLIDLDGLDGDVPYPDWDCEEGYGFQSEADAISAITKWCEHRILAALEATT